MSLVSQRLSWAYCFCAYCSSCSTTRCHERCWLARRGQSCEVMEAEEEIEAGGGGESDMAAVAHLWQQLRSYQSRSSQK